MARLHKVFLSWSPHRIWHSPNISPISPIFYLMKENCQFYNLVRCQQFFFVTDQQPQALRERGTEKPLPIISLAPAASRMVKMSDGKSGWSWVNIKFPAILATYNEKFLVFGILITIINEIPPLFNHCVIFAGSAGCWWKQQQREKRKEKWYPTSC